MNDLRRIRSTHDGFFLSPSGRGFHEKAGRCQENFSIVLPGGSHKGAGALLWGEPPILRRGGNPPRPGVPLGEPGRGQTSSSSLPQAVGLAPHPVSHFLFAIADSPCFHSHSVVKHLLRCQLVSSILKRVLPSQNRTELSFQKARSATTSQSPELGDVLSNSNLVPDL
jgi:hypothetical protein